MNDTSSLLSISITSCLLGRALYMPCVQYAYACALPAATASSWISTRLLDPLVTDTTATCPVCQGGGGPPIHRRVMHACGREEQPSMALQIEQHDIFDIDRIKAIGHYFFGRHGRDDCLRVGRRRPHHLADPDRRRMIADPPECRSPAVKLRTAAPGTS